MRRYKIKLIYDIRTICMFSASAFRRCGITVSLLRMLCYMNSVDNGFYSSSGYYSSHFFTMSIAVNRLVRGTQASNSLKAWYSAKAVDLLTFVFSAWGEQRTDNLSHLFLPPVWFLCEVAFLQILLTFYIFPSPIPK